MFDLSDAFVAARPIYQDYARYLAERGEYGAVEVEVEVRRFRSWSAPRVRLSAPGPTAGSFVQQKMAALGS